MTTSCHYQAETSSSEPHAKEDRGALRIDKAWMEIVMLIRVEIKKWERPVFRNFKTVHPVPSNQEDGDYHTGITAW